MAKRSKRHFLSAGVSVGLVLGIIAMYFYIKWYTWEEFIKTAHMWFIMLTVMASFVAIIVKQNLIKKKIRWW